MGRLLKFLIALIVVAGLTWLAVSPWFSVQQVRTAGILTSDANRVLADNRVVAGTPMILLRPGQVEEQLLLDPWIKDARVHRSWPDEVIVRVVERVPVAWVQTGDGWVRRSIDGAGLPSASSPDDSLPHVFLGSVAGELAEESPLVLGAVEFYERLPINYSVGSSMRVQDGEVWATVAGHEVRLGRPVEMADKAAALSVMLDQPMRADAVIILIAPTHPAIAPAGSTTPNSGPPDR